ncbi:hypothetical protein SLE2022_215320 [Rubroshorea leprosula]
MKATVGLLRTTVEQKVEEKTTTKRNNCVEKGQRIPMLHRIESGSMKNATIACRMTEELNKLANASSFGSRKKTD